MGLFLIWCHRLICMHIYKDIIWCKSVCDIKSRIDPFPLLAQSWNRLWPAFLTFTASKKSRLGLKSDKKVQYVSNRCKDLFKRKKYFEVRFTLRERQSCGIKSSLLTALFLDSHLFSIHSHRWFFSRVCPTRNVLKTIKHLPSRCFFALKNLKQLLYRHIKSSSKRLSENFWGNST